MKKIIFGLACLCSWAVTKAENAQSEETFVVCKKIKLENSVNALECELFEVSSLRSIDTWIATIPPNSSDRKID